MLHLNGATYQTNKVEGVETAESVLIVEVFLNNIGTRFQT